MYSANSVQKIDTQYIFLLQGTKYFGYKTIILENFFIYINTLLFFVNKSRFIVLFL